MQHTSLEVGFPATVWSWLLTTSFRSNEFWPRLESNRQQTCCSAIACYWPQSEGRMGWIPVGNLCQPAWEESCCWTTCRCWAVSLWSEAKRKPEKCLIKISTRMQKHSPPPCILKWPQQTKNIFIFLQLLMETIWYQRQTIPWLQDHSSNLLKLRNTEECMLCRSSAKSWQWISSFPPLLSQMWSPPKCIWICSSATL